MYDTDVVVVGAGPVGLALALSLATRGVRAMIVDKVAAGANASRATLVNARTLEVLTELDVARRLVAAGITVPRFTIQDRSRTLMPVDFSNLPTPYPYSLIISQEVTERILSERLIELGGAVIRPKTGIR